MKRPFLFAAFAIGLAASPAIAGDDVAAGGDLTSTDREVLTSVQMFMHGIESKDPATMRSLVTPSGFVALIEEREGTDRLVLVELDTVIASLTGRQGDFAEPIANEIVMVEGPVAMVWTTFDFLVEGERSHCGINIFTLVRVDGDWKIASVTSSHIEEGCPE